MQQTIIIKQNNGQKIVHTNIILKREKLEGGYFLEFGKHKIGDFQYISLLKGDINYYGENSLKHEELYFAFKKKNQWRVLDATRVKVIEDFRKKVDAVNRLRSFINLK